MASVDGTSISKSSSPAHHSTPSSGNKGEPEKKESLIQTNTKIQDVKR